MVTLQKVHGSENSFFLFDETQLTQPLTNTQLATVTQQLTNAETGLLAVRTGSWPSRRRRERLAK